MQKLAEMIPRLLYCLTSVMMVELLKLQKWSLLRWQIMSKRIVDVVFNVDGLILNDGESVEDVANFLERKLELVYKVVYSVTYEETIDD